VDRACLGLKVSSNSSPVTFTFLTELQIKVSLSAAGKTRVIPDQGSIKCFYELGVSLNTLCNQVTLVVSVFLNVAGGV
jgi:hypothetical protein